MFTTATLITLLNLLFRLIDIYCVLLVIYALISWFPGAYDSPLGRFLSKVCEPYLSLFERFPLRLGNIDFTIMVAVIVLELASQGLSIIIMAIL